MKDNEIYKNRLVILDEFYRLLPAQRRRRLTIPEIFHRAYDENFISDYLAHILNPSLNGIGAAPLQALLGLAGEETDVEGAEVVIEREHTFKDGGRIDLLVRIGEDTLLGIENKITAAEGPEQTISYQRSIAREFPGRRHCLVFLTPQGTQASSAHFKNVSYADLSGAYRAIPFSPLPDIHKSVIWEDFLAHLEDYIVMGKKNLELSEKTRLYLRHQEMLDDLVEAAKQDGLARQEYALGRIRETFAGWDLYGQANGASHWLVKKEWYFDKATYAFIQFMFTPMDLIKARSIGFGVGVYPVNATTRPFIEIFRSQYAGEVHGFCVKAQLEAFARRGGPNFWIAWKNYPYDAAEPAFLDSLFPVVWEEMKPLEAIIDRAMDGFLLDRNNPGGAGQGSFQVEN